MTNTDLAQKLTRVYQAASMLVRQWEYDANPGWNQVLTKEERDDLRRLLQRELYEAVKS